MQGFIWRGEALVMYFKLVIHTPQTFLNETFTCLGRHTHPHTHREREKDFTMI